MADAKDTYMQYQISGIHIDVGDALQTHVRGELGDSISKYAERPTDAQIIFQKVVTSLFVTQSFTYRLDWPQKQKLQKRKSTQLLTRVLKK